MRSPRPPDNAPRHRTRPLLRSAARPPRLHAPGQKLHLQQARTAWRRSPPPIPSPSSPSPPTTPPTPPSPRSPRLSARPSSPAPRRAPPTSPSASPHLNPPASALAPAPSTSPRSTSLLPPPATPPLASSGPKPTMATPTCPGPPSPVPSPGSSEPASASNNPLGSWRKYPQRVARIREVHPSGNGRGGDGVAPGKPEPLQIQDFASKSWRLNTLQVYLPGSAVMIGLSGYPGVGGGGYRTGSPDQPSSPR